MGIAKKDVRLFLTSVGSLAAYGRWRCHRMTVPYWQPVPTTSGSSYGTQQPDNPGGNCTITYSGVVELPSCHGLVYSCWPHQFLGGNVIQTFRRLFIFYLLWQ